MDQIKRVPTVKLFDKSYELSTKLRVAYKVQGKNGHKPYSEIFQKIDTMTLEDQVAILYCAFEVANPDAATDITFQKFLGYYLDNYSVGTIMDQLQDIIGGILGQDLKSPESDATTEPEGN